MTEEVRHSSRSCFRSGRSGKAPWKKGYLSKAGSVGLKVAAEGAEAVTGPRKGQSRTENPPGLGEHKQ